MYAAQLVQGLMRNVAWISDHTPPFVWVSLDSVQPAQPYMTGKWEKERRKSWETKEDHSSQTQTKLGHQ